MPEPNNLRALPAPATQRQRQRPWLCPGHPRADHRLSASYAFPIPSPKSRPSPSPTISGSSGATSGGSSPSSLVCVAATVVISSRLTPIYESTATIDIDRQVPPAVIGQDAARMAPNDADQFLATQIKIIQSDSVLRPVALQLPPPGRRNRPCRARPALPTARAQNAPVTLKNLKVTRPPNTYLLLISYRSPDPDLAADVANGVADSYIQHTYNIRFRATAGLSAFMEKQMEELRAKMERSSAALAQFERDLSVINPEEKTSILSSRLLQLNTEFTTAQADRVRKEAAYNSVKSGSLEAAQASTQGEQLRRLADRWMRPARSSPSSRPSTAPTIPSTRRPAPSSRSWSASSTP